MNSLIDADIRRAIVAAEGGVADAAEILGVPYGELIELLARRPDLRDFLVDVRDALMDDAQAALAAAVDEQSPWAIRFALKTLGASRGYGNQPETSGVDNLPALGPEPAPLTAEKQAEIARLLGRTTEEQIADALDRAKGHVTLAAAELGMPRSDLKNIIAGRFRLEAVLVETLAMLVDKAEWALAGAIAEKKPWAIRFVLNTLARDRGYGRRKANRTERHEGATPSNSTPPITSLNTERAPTVPADAPTYQPALSLSPSPSAQKSPNVPIGSTVFERVLPITGLNEPVRNAPCPCGSGMKYKHCCGSAK